jgi:hypothetical protein
MEKIAGFHPYLLYTDILQIKQSNPILSKVEPLGTEPHLQFLYESYDLERTNKSI